ncbi:MAG TPA: hypothetical protein VFZ65_14400, partial [Planctomycetota bacterium]|nr:hypothetical protein [Planctomycetota bacterium]
LVAKGQLRICVVSDVRSLPGAHRGPYLHEQVVVVPAQAAVQRCDFDVPATRLEIAVVGELPPVIRPLVFHVEGTAAIAGAAMGFELEPSEGNAGTWVGMPPGTWTVTAESGWIVPAAPQTVQITASTPSARVELLAEPAGIVGLTLRAANGREYAPPASTLPPLRAGGRLFAATNVRRYVRGSASWGYVSVPAGPAEVLLEDREVEGQCVFQPFDVQSPHAIDVVIGDHNAVEIYVEPRAQVDVRAVDVGGGEDVDARVSVSWGARSVASVDNTRPWRWYSFLPPGEYRIVVERNGVQKEQLLHVARENLQLRLRP